MLIFGNVLIPFCVAAADVILESEIRERIFAAEGEFIEIHRSPIIPHIGAQVARPAFGFGGFQTLQ